jgi:hypothetical protein
MPLNPKRVPAALLEATSCHDLAGCAAILDRECLGDSESRQRIDALLKAHDQFNDFVNQPLDGPGGRAPRFYAVLRGFRTPGDRARRIAASLRRARKRAGDSWHSSPAATGAESSLFSRGLGSLLPIRAHHSR